MSDPRNAAHAKKVTHEKKHEKKHHQKGAAAGAAPVPEVPPAGASAAASKTLTPKLPAALEGSMAVLAKLKEMEFYSRANLEGLAALVLTVGDELKQKAVLDPLDAVYSAQNAFQTKLTTLIEAYKAECGRLQSENA
jgi:hypothetical protein